MATRSFAKVMRGTGKGGKRDGTGLGHRTPAPHQLFGARHGGRRGKRR
ncbi:MAG: hypothetical protein HRJ53_21680 [Acidobacteria bacterium Pan2503]|uniref:Uncharacterized protein n=1 Tax=Candidatus Acidiferrum panamense TaxID=2741543 RepID=A0A7V8NU66_9BACT|nr:hypothetical protein [Candidatus Acidoferrum panamensis]